MHAVMALVLPAVEAFDLAIPAQVFADPGLPRRYEFTVCAPEAGLVVSTAGFSVRAEHGLEALAAADTADERALADTAVLDPARTAATDVSRVLWAEEVPQNVRVSGHVYDVGTGLVTTVVDAKGRK